MLSAMHRNILILSLFFLVLLPLTCSAAVPEMARVSPLDGSNVFQVFGENLAGAEAYIWQPPAGEGRPEMKAPALPKTPPKEARPVKIINQQGQVLYALSPNLNGTGVLWLKNIDGFSAPRLVNRPEIWNRSSDEAVPGERFQVFGQNLRASPRPWCVLRGSDGKVYQAVWGPIQSQEMPYQERYKMEVVLPKDASAGDYELLVHNGSGGAWGWSEPVPLKISAKRDLIGLFNMAWNRVNLDVDTQEMLDARIIRIDAALGDGLKDAVPAIQKAINDLHAAGGGIVSLPPGNFGISTTLHLRPGVVLKGAGRNASSISVPFGRHLKADWTGFSQAPTEYTPLIWIETDAGLEDICLIGGAGAGGMIQVRTLDGGVSRRVFLNRVVIDNPGRRQVYPEGEYRGQTHSIFLPVSSRYFTMWNCTVKSPDSLNIPGGRHYFLRLLGNRFEDSPRQTSNVLVMKGIYDSMIAENTMMDGKRTLISQQGFYRNWVFQNRSSGVGRGGNGHEEFMSEYGGDLWLGKAARVLPDAVVAPAGAMQKKEIRDNAAGRYEMHLYIASGRGLGQYRAVAGIEGDRIILDTPWAVMPDTNTEFALMRLTNKNLWVNNSCGPGSGISQFIYGAGVENIIAGHQTLDNGQISLFAFGPNEQYPLYGTLAFNQVIGCESRFAGGHNSALVLWSQRSITPFYAGRPYTILGNIVRHNIISGSVEAAQMKNLWGGYWQAKAGDRMNFDPDKASGVELNGGYNLVDNNFVMGMPVGVRVRGNGEGNLIYNNRIDRADISVLDETGKSTVTPPARQDYKAVVPTEPAK